MPTRLYRVPGYRNSLSDAEFQAWLERSPSEKAAPPRQTLALLIIRETADEAGFTRECSIERRRGSTDGPFYGNPARVEITWPEERLRVYRLTDNGTLAKSDIPKENQLNRENMPEQFYGELQAVHDHFAVNVSVSGCRLPTAIEELVGLDTILCVRLPDGSMVDCGVGWHRTVPFVVQAVFPRFGAPLMLTAEQDAAVQDFITSHGLVRQETRADGSGLVVVALRRSQDELFLLRVKAGAITAEPYQRAPRTLASEDQVRWMNYIETYERLSVLDAWKGDGSDDLFVITTDGEGEAWRHHVDPDGVETWRMLDEQLASGMGSRARDGGRVNEGRIRLGPRTAGAANRSSALTRFGHPVEDSHGVAGKDLPVVPGRGLLLGRAGESIAASTNGRPGLPSVESPSAERQ